MPHWENIGNMELTVGMPVHNGEPYILQVIKSILKQENISFELVIVDDGSKDQTLEIIQSFQNPRVKVIQHAQPRGMACCQNTIIQQSQTPFITFVKPYQIVLPGALRRMTLPLVEDPTIGQVYCYCLNMKVKEFHSRNGFRESKQRALKKIHSEIKRNKNSLISDVQDYGLWTYRREVFDEFSLFYEPLEGQHEPEMMVRMQSRYDAMLVPNFLCWSKDLQSSRHSRNRQNPETRRWIANGIWQLSKLFKPKKIAHIFRRSLIGFISNSKKLILSCGRSLGRECYLRAVILLSRWPIAFWKRKPPCKKNTPVRVGYYLWRFPILSQTFIQREIMALQEVGVSVTIVADKPGDWELLDHQARALCDQTTYLFPVDLRIARKYFFYFLFRNPLRLVNLFLYVVGRQYEKTKNIQKDIRLFLKAIYLAGHFKDMNITRVHSPWSNRIAFVSLIASHLLHVPYTVQARASDIHRRLDRHALEEKFSHAQVVFTNTRFNQDHLKQYLPEKKWSNIQVIYNGLDLKQFVPGITKKNPSGVLSLLSIGRLIEPKGLIYLIEACRLLMEKRYQFRCEIVGGSEVSEMANFVRLKKLRREFGLEAYITLSGPQPFNQVLTRYQSADIFILPCVRSQDGSQDITPNALIEAMAMKLPVISTQSTGIPEIVDDGVNGILVPPKNAQALAEALMKLMKDAHLRQRLGEQARKKVERRFDIKKNVYHWVKYFEGKTQKVLI